MARKNTTYNSHLKVSILTVLCTVASDSLSGLVDDNLRHEDEDNLRPGLSSISRTVPNVPEGADKQAQ